MTQQAFETFWAVYPKRVAKLDARRAYQQASKVASPDEILAGVTRYIKSKPAWQEWKHPAAWLRAGRWMDEESAQEQPKAKVGSVEYYARSWRLECQHDPPCNSYDWHCIALEKEAQRA